MAVYFIQQVGRVGPIKIGLTGDDNLRMRLHSIQSMCPVRLEIIKAIPGDVDTEKGIHNQFSEIRLHGEWFKPTKQLLEFIAAQDKLKIRLHAKPRPQTYREWQQGERRCSGITRRGTKCNNFVPVRHQLPYCYAHKQQANGAA